jgi:hypothetical protein
MIVAHGEGTPSAMRWYTRHMKRFFALTAFAALACSKTPQVMMDGHKVSVNDWAKQRPLVEARAKFDLKCEADITFVVLKTGAERDGTWGGVWDDEVSQVGARGCGRQATYVRGPEGWLMNGAATQVSESK